MSGLRESEADPMLLLRHSKPFIVVLGLLGIGTPQVAADYMIADLSAPGSALGSFANGINTSGEVVGVGISRGPVHTPPYAYSAILWQNGRVTDLGPGYA